VKEKKTESRNYTYEYINHFLEQDPTPGIEWEYNVALQLLPGIQLEEVNKLIDQFIHKDNRVVVITGPDRESVNSLEEQHILDAFERIENEDIEPYEDEEVASSIMIDQPVKGTITDISFDKQVGVTILQLGNGATIKYKKTDFKDDEILFSAFSPGGTSLFTDEEYISTYLALDGLTEAGINGFSKSELTKMMAGKVVSVNPYIGSIQEGMSGSTRPKDLETLFQLVHAYFTGLNKDEEAYNSFVAKQKGFLQNLLANPQVYFQVEFGKYVNANNPRATGLPTEEDWAKTDYDLAFDKFNERFADAGDFTFYFIGNLEEEAIKEYAEKYIASLSGDQTGEKGVDRGYRPIGGIQNKAFYKGSEPKSMVVIMFTGEADYDPKEAHAMKSLGEILSIKLIEKLREEKSGVYGAGANGNMSKVPYGSYRFSISFPCGPENVEALKEAALKELNDIIENGPTQKDLEKIKEAQLLDFKENLKKNRYWLNQIKKADTDGIESGKFLQTEKAIEELSAADIQKVGAKYLKENRIIGVLYPEKGEE
jgi:zinc protease